MRKHIGLRIENPCSENWNQMTPAQKGRFCNACQKTVIDFTAMSDNEILAWFDNRQKAQTLNQLQGSPAASHTCGRFTPSQLNRPLIPHRQHYTPATLWRYLIAGLLISSKASAQGKPAILTTTQSDTIIRRQLPQLTGITAILPNNKIITGKIVDESNNPLQYVTVQIAGTKTATVTDPNGHFSLRINTLDQSTQIQISYVGFVTQTIPVDDKFYNNQEPVIRMKQTVQGLTGDVVIVKSQKRKAAPSLLAKIKDTLGFGKKALNIYPNPVPRGSSVNISINLDQTGAYTAQLYSISGALLESMEIEGGQQEKHVLMDIPSTLAPGNYIVRLSHPNLKKPYTQQIAIL